MSDKKPPTPPAPQPKPGRVGDSAPNVPARGDVIKVERPRDWPPPPPPAKNDKT